MKTCQCCSEAHMCLWWPGKTAAGQKRVLKDSSIFNSSCLGFGMI